MKRVILFSFSLFFTFISWCKEVSKEEATAYALKYMQSRVSQSIGVKDITTIGNDDGVCYVINFAPQGWIIIAGNDVVIPIIAYSTENQLDAKSLPDNMEYMLGECEQQIREIVKVGSKPHPRWRNPQSVLSRSGVSSIEPLIKVNWNQSSPYNKYCPQGKALVGCVAVAMAQAMSVQRYPARPQGAVSYTSPNYGGLSINFNAERAYNWDDIMTGADDNNETARLLFHAGMSVHMKYSEESSGVLVSEAGSLTSNALKENFSYPETVTYHWRDYYDGNWEQLILNELNAGRAVVYNALDSKEHAGHSFNIDGYDGEGNFHVNWGWGGHGNGHFILNGLRDQFQGMHFDSTHLIVVGIGAPDQILKGISLSNTRIEEGLGAGANVGTVLVNGESPKASYSITVHGTYNPQTNTYNQVPFTYQNGMLRTTEVLDAAISTRDIEITVEDSESKQSLTQGFRITVDPWKSIEATTQLSYDRTTRTFILITKHNVVYTIQDEQGIVLKDGLLEPLPELKINADDLPAGSNTIELRCADEVKRFQIVTKKK